MLTVKQLRDKLDQCDDHAEVVFSPRKSCAIGFPEWHDCRVVELEGNLALVELEEEGD